MLGFNDQRGRGCILAGRKNERKKGGWAGEEGQVRDGGSERKRGRQITAGAKKREEVGAE